MADVANPTGSYKLEEWTQEVIDLGNLYGYIRSRNYFDVTPVNQRTVLFDRTENNIRMMKPVNKSARGDRQAGSDDDVYPIALQTEFYEGFDYITPDDIEGQRMVGTAQTEETVSNVRAKKLAGLRLSHDQRDEFLRFNALAGNLRPKYTGGQNSDIYSLLGKDKANFTVDLDTGNAGVNLDAKINEVKHLISDNLRAGQVVQGIDIYMDTTLFNELVNNTSYREVYLNRDTNQLTGDMSDYYAWGVMDSFSYRGLNFFEYNPTFADENGDEVQVLGEGKGIAVPRGAFDMFRGHYGRPYKLMSRMMDLQELYAFEWEDPNGENYTIQCQADKLYYATRPAIVQLT